MTSHHHFRILISSIALSLTAVAQIQPASVFSDHMVLQRGRPIAIWGTAKPSEAVTVALDKTTVDTVADDSGRWSVRLAAQQAGGPYQLRLKGTNEVILEDVLIGEVWICSGQSNMNWTMRSCDDTKAVLEQVTDPQLRVLQIPRHANQDPQDAAKATWDLANPKSLSNFSAVAYGFGRHLRGALGVPVGLIQSSWGGTRAEAWTREPALGEHDVLRPILERWEKTYLRYPAQKEAYEEALATWREQSSVAKAANKKAPRKPRAPVGPNDRHAPSRLFNGMIQPLLPLAIRGVIWYQGESNVGRAYQYRTLFPAMITDWREAFGQGQFPFLFVQLAAFEAKGIHPHVWAELREAQTMTLSLPNTGMACTIDIGEKNNIHPPHKLEVGRRLGLLACKQAYGEDCVASGPLFSHYEVEGAQIRVHFDSVGAGLVGKGGALTGFEIATADGDFEPASAVIDGDTVVVYGRSILEPRHVRYAWRHWPTCNLFNADGLPASPFRTDSRKGRTADAR